jgi:glutaconate CoA-transferase subunit B
MAASSIHDVMLAAQAGFIDYAFLGAAAMDAYGNLNTTVVGNWERPKVRLPGSGGDNDLGARDPAADRGGTTHPQGD